MEGRWVMAKSKNGQCQRLISEVWRAPGGGGLEAGPSRDMEAQCLLKAGHDKLPEHDPEFSRYHKFGAYSERSRIEVIAVKDEEGI